MPNTPANKDRWRPNLSVYLGEGELGERRKLALASLAKRAGRRTIADLLRALADGDLIVSVAPAERAE